MQGCGPPGTSLTPLSECQRWRWDVEQGKKKKITDLSEPGKHQLHKKSKKHNKNRKEKAEARKHRLSCPIIEVAVRIFKVK